MEKHRVQDSRAGAIGGTAALALLLLLSVCAFAQTADARQAAELHGRDLPGQSVFGKYEFIEYVVGNLPLIISVPHGGYLRPESIPNRELATPGRQDTKTQELAREIIESFRQETGKYPHVIINRLHRDKLDANRESFDAAQDNPIASVAWQEFHDFIDSAQHAVERQSGRSLYIDLHGHRHTQQVVELGYLLVSSQLQLSDRQLDSVAAQPVTSFGDFAVRRGVPPSRMIRGDLSLGALLGKHRIAAVPSPDMPHPDGNPYFSGGYNLEQHSAFSGRRAWGIQVELPTGIREDDTKRRSFAITFMKCMIEFLSIIGE
jgi:N-formylglutamate amidohydrolase